MNQNKEDPEELYRKELILSLRYLWGHFRAKYLTSTLEYSELLQWDEVCKRLRALEIHVTYNFLIPRYQLN